MTPEQRRVLFVEDNDDHAELVLHMLRKHDRAGSVFRVADGQAALDYLHRRGEFVDAETHPIPDVILLDLRLPKLDGFEVLKELKSSESLRRIPVVVMTTSEAERDVARAYDLQANAYVVKPLDFGKFGTLMNDLGLFWLGWNRLPHTA